LKKVLKHKQQILVLYNPTNSLAYKPSMRNDIFQPLQTRKIERHSSTIQKNQKLKTMPSE